MRIRSGVVVAVGAIALMTLWPMPGTVSPNERWCLICGTLGGVDLLGNIVLFLPLGVALGVTGMSPLRAAIDGAVVSTVVEILQWRVVPGRDASPADVLANSIGAFCGVLLLGAILTLRNPHNAGARRVMVGWVVAQGLLWSVGAWGLRPALSDQVFFSQWTPVRPSYAPFRGRLEKLALFGVDLPNGDLIDPTTRDPRYSSGVVDVDIVFRPGPADATQLLARAGNPLGDAFEVARSGRDLHFRSRRSAVFLGLRSPAFTFEDLLPAAEDSMVSLRLRSEAGRVVSTDLMSQHSDTLDVTVGYAWQVFTPFEVRRRSLQLAGTILLLALTVAPVVAWSAYARSAAATAAVVALVATLWLVVMPLAGGLTPGGVPETIGVAAGILAGLLGVARAPHPTA